jgi:hypothetical protein
VGPGFLSEFVLVRVVFDYLVTAGFHVLSFSRVGRHGRTEFSELMMHDA